MVSVVIINYNTFTLTSNCIRSVIAYTRGIEHEIIMVDNASVECAPEKFLDEFPQVRLIKSDRNGGFAYGNNLGIAASMGEYILLLNSDTILAENSIANSVAWMKEQKGLGVMGCRMVFPDGKVQYTARRFRSISWELLDLIRIIPWMTGYRNRSKRMLGKYFRHDEDMECDWVNGAFFLFPRSVLNKLPGQKLDDRFFMYGEDQLWCEQIRQLGYGVKFYAGTTIVHINSGSSDISKHLKLRRTMMQHELEIMKLRKGRGFYYFTFKLIYVFKESVRNLIKSLVFRSSGKMMR